MGELLPTLQAGNAVGQLNDTGVSGIKVTVAVLACKTGIRNGTTAWPCRKAVLRQRTTICGYFIQAVTPGIGKLRAQSVPCIDAQGGLQRAVVRSADTLNLVDVSIVDSIRLNSSVVVIGTRSLIYAIRAQSCLIDFEKRK